LLKPPCTSCNRCSSFTRTSSSILGIPFYSARLILNSLSGSIHHFEDISILSQGGPALSMPVPLQHHLPCHIYPTPYRATPFLDSLWLVVAYCPLPSSRRHPTDLWRPGTPVYPARCSYTCVARPLSVFVHLVSLFDVFPCLAFSLTIRDCFFARTLIV
jgi:hypothetical protein